MAIFQLACARISADFETVSVAQFRANGTGIRGCHCIVRTKVPLYVSYNLAIPTTDEMILYVLQHIII